MWFFSVLQQSRPVISIDNAKAKISSKSCLEKSISNKLHKNVPKKVLYNRFFKNNYLHS